MPQPQSFFSPPTLLTPPGIDPRTYLRAGSKGPQVKTLQARLASLHYGVGKVDGDFGEKTLAAVKAFQRAKGLVIDGVVGPKTAGALGLSAAFSAKPEHTPAPSIPSKAPASNVSHTVAKALVDKFASAWSTDEEGLAQALYGRGSDVQVVTQAFKRLEAEYCADADDVALAYVKLVRARGGAALEMLRKERTLRQLLMHALATGVTFPDEDAQIHFLRGLGGSGPASASSQTPATAAASSSAEAMVRAALAQDGKDYVYGVEVKASNSKPTAFDCSELVEWAVSQAGGSIPDGSQNQRHHCQKHKTTLPVEKALKTRGALLFTDIHVAISLGDGRVIEAANAKKGVCIQNATGRAWKEAGLVPGLNYGAQGAHTAAASPAKASTKPPTQPVASAAPADAQAGNVVNHYVLYPNEVRGKGSIAWRNNNPGNIRNGAFANAHGAFKGKHNRHFAIFPDPATGFAALIALLKTQVYQPLSVMDAMERYAPSSDNNDPAAYARTLSKLTGLDVHRTLSSLNDADLRKFATAIQKVEGWKVGVVYARNDSKLVALGIQPTGSAQGTTGGAKAEPVAAKKPDTVPATKTQATGKSTVKAPSVANAETLKKLGQQARKRMALYNKGMCAKGVCEMLSAAGYACGTDRPRVSSGIISKVYDYGTGRWVLASVQGHYVSKHGHLDNKTHAVKAGSPVKTVSGLDCAKYMKHTLEMLKFVECTSVLTGHGSLGTPPEASVKALRALPEGSVVVFGPAISRSVEKASDGTYVLGGAGHAGHVGILLHAGKDVLVVADGLLVGNGSKYTVESCLSSYAWAVGFVPTTAPLKVSAQARPTNTA